MHNLSHHNASSTCKVGTGTTSAKHCLPSFHSPLNSCVPAHAFARRCGSVFATNEYVVYDTARIQLQYIVRCSFEPITHSALRLPVTPSQAAPPVTPIADVAADAWAGAGLGGSEEQEYAALREAQERIRRRQVPPAIAALEALDGSCMPLKGVHVRATCVDLAAQVVVLQR